MAIIQYKTPGYTTTLGACAATASATPLEFYYDTSVTPTLVATAGATPGTILYNEDTFDTEFDGNNDWWALITDAATPTCQIIKISGVGEVLEISVDVCPPVITLNGDATVNLTVGDTWTDPGATATDGCDGTITITDVNGIPANTNMAGTYTITYNVSDAAGNPATQVARTVIISAAVDTTIPVITLIGSATVSITVGDTYTDAGATASDNIDGDITANIITAGIPANTNTAGTHTITYNVSDAALNSAVEVTRTLTIVPAPTSIPPTPTPDNAPVATAAAYDIAWGATLSITLVGTDDQDTGNLTYAITSNPTRGTVVLVGNTATYTHTALTIGSDSFEFTATDTAGQTSAPATITINPLNAAPAITDPGTQTVTQNSFGNFSVSISDTDIGDSFTYTVVSAAQDGDVTINSQTGNTLSFKYTPNIGHVGYDDWTIKVTDSRGADSAPLQVQFVIESTPVFEMNIGSFGSDPDVLCYASKNGIAYGQTEEAQNVGLLSVGDRIFYDQNFTNSVISNNLVDLFVPVSDSLSSAILKIDSTGEITEITTCTNLAVSTSINVKYATNTITYCANDVQNITLWYNGSDVKTLAQLVADNTPLFSSEYYSNLYTSTEGATELGVIESGIYSELASVTDYYKRSTESTWGSDTLGSKLWHCEEDVVNTTHELITAKKSNLLDPSINQFCAATTTTVSLYYVRPSGLASFTSLLELAQENTAIYKTEIGAQSQDDTDLYESNIFSDDNGYLAWDNLGDGSTLNWYGYLLNGLLAKGSEMTSYGTCADYSQPVISNEIVQRSAGDASVNEVNVFYAFYSHDPEIEGIQSGSLVETLFWPIYIVDGLHTNLPGDTGSHVKTFIDTISFGNVIKPSVAEICLEYVYKIVAEDIDDASYLLSNALTTPLTSQQRLVITSANTLGLASESSVKIYENIDSSKCIIGDDSTLLTTYMFPIISGYDAINAGPNFNTQTNYKLDNVAKPLLRTNPKLSGNVKIVTSSNGSIYLESISASKDLADIKYKKNVVNPNGNYAKDVSTFFKSKGTPSDLIYLTKRSQSDLTVLDAYDKQIEEEYQYGTSYNYSKNYTEKYRLFAPIWADINMPNNFVIFKVKNPTGDDFGTTNGNTPERIQNLLKNSEIVKTFDLTNNSNLGKYIRTHIQQETFPKSPISVSFGKNETTNYNGIDLSSGELTSKGEYIYKDYVEADKPLVEANDFITDGFKRNNILAANLLNLEFLFDDDSSDYYTVNRYFGLYVDDIDSGTGEISSISNNGVIKFSKVTSLVDSNNPITAIPSFKQMSTTPTLGYVKINDIYYKISNAGLYDPANLEVKIDDSTDVIPNTIGLSYNKKSVDLIKNDERGYDFVKLSILDKPESGDRIAAVSSREEAYKFTFIKHTPSENITVSINDSTGTFEFSFTTGATFVETTANMVNTWDSLDLQYYLNLDIDYATQSFVISENQTNLGDLNMSISGAISSIVRVDQIQSNISIQNRMYVANYLLPKGTYSNKQFSNQGTTGDIASALASAIHGDDSQLDSYNVGSDIFITARVPGYRLLQHTVLLSKSNVIDFVKISNLDTENILKLRNGPNTVLADWTAYYLNGGNSSSKSIYINNSTLSEISIGDYLETSYAGVYNKVLDIVEDISVPNSTKSKLILGSISDLKDGEARVFNQNIVNIGLFSAYDVYDMNFDFYDTSNSDLKELSLETTENIAYEPYTHALTNIDPITGEFNTILEGTDIFSDEYALEPVNYFSNLSGILSEESVFDGESINITSEFDRLKENQLKEFAINSRVVPNINKWVLKDSLTVRDQPYYLNTNEAFGRTNFSPDLTAIGRNKVDMTHEWFYMDKKPKYLRYDQLNDTFSYVNFLEGFELTADLFKSTKNDYFDKFMITEGFEKNLNIDDIENIYNNFGEYNLGYLNTDDINNTFFKTNLKKKYTLIDGGTDSSFANTIFKGIKVVLKNRKEFTNNTALDFVKRSEFNGYKFSILLKTNTDVSNNSVEFEVIQNKKFKFVILFVNLNLSDYWIKGNMNRKLLYELNHKIVYDHNAGDYIYANTPFDGALNWNQADFTGSGPYDIEGITHFDGSEPDFDNQLLLGETGLYGDVLMDLYPNTPGNAIYKFSIYTIENSTAIKVIGKPVNVNDPGDILDVAYLPNNIQKRIKYSYVDGGTSIHKATLDKISINNVANTFNLDNDSVNYTTVESDGTINNNRFTINFEDGTEIIKYATLSVEEDNDKPKSYKLFKGIIGYDLVSSADASYYPFLIRHNGSYTVDFTPVITFTDMYTHFKSNRLQASADKREIGFESAIYKHSLTNNYELTTAKKYYERYNRCGTTFNIGFIQDGGFNDNRWGIIKNHFYHKVNETNPTGITKLSQSSDKLPLYPLIDEIAIGKKDVNVFKSSWDSGYYTRSLSGGKSEEIPGTLDNTEERSYFASTAMKIKDKYDLISFTSSRIDSKEELDEILKGSTNELEVLFFEDDKEIIADFYVTDITTRILKEDGVLSRIQNLVSVQNSAGDKTTVSDDADFYISKNLISQFVVDAIQLYTIRFKGSSSTISNATDVNLITASGHTPDNNFTYKAHKQKPMNFRLIYNKRLGYSYDIQPMIKIKS